MMKYVENTFTFLRERWVQLGNAFLFIKPVCASPPALFKRGSQTLALAYLIFAPLPTSWKMGARTSRPLEVTKRNLFAGIFLRKNISSFLNNQTTPRAIFLQEYFCARESLHKNISSFPNHQRTPRAIFLQDKYQRTSGVTSDKAQFFWKQVIFCYSF